MIIWNRYAQIISRNFGLDKGHLDTSIHWRTTLTYYCILFIIPLVLIPYLPGILYAYKVDYLSVIILDTLAVGLLMVAGFWPNLRISLRKFLFVAAFYVASVGFLFIIGLSGPAFLYMLAASFFCTILFPVKYAFYPAIANVIFCVIIGLLIPFEVMLWKDDPNHNIPEFIAVASNLIFLGFFASALFPKVFDLLEKSIHNERILKNQLNQRNNDLENALEKVEKKHAELETFAYSASHDLQEPLRMITAFLQQLEKKYNPLLDEKGKKYIHFATDGASRMKDMITALLEYSRVGRFDGPKTSIDLNELVENTTRLFQVAIKEKKAKIIVHPLPIVASYELPISQIFLNLIGNALKYSKPDIAPIIEISGEEKETYWEFSVKDNGIGIEKGFHERIFNLFQKLHHKKDFEGTGIGLAIVKKCVENLGGKINIESKVLIGSNFSFKIPKK